MADTMNPAVKAALESVTGSNINNIGDYHRALQEQTGASEVSKGTFTTLERKLQTFIGSFGDNDQSTPVVAARNSLRALEVEAAKQHPPSHSHPHLAVQPIYTVTPPPAPIHHAAPAQTQTNPSTTVAAAHTEHHTVHHHAHHQTTHHQGVAHLNDKEALLSNHLKYLGFDVSTPDNLQSSIKSFQEFNTSPDGVPLKATGKFDARTAEAAGLKAKELQKQNVAGDLEQAGFPVTNDRSLEQAQAEYRAFRASSEPGHTIQELRAARDGAKALGLSDMAEAIGHVQLGNISVTVPLKDAKMAHALNEVAKVFPHGVSIDPFNHGPAAKTPDPFIHGPVGTKAITVSDPFDHGTKLTTPTATNKAGREL